jgi:hypothetical protein
MPALEGIPLLHFFWMAAKEILVVAFLLSIKKRKSTG